MSNKQKFLLSIDQGTSSSRSVVFDQLGGVVASAQQEFPQEYPQPGWVEHDPEAIWQSVLNVSREALQKSGVNEITSVGITNQRETTLIWNRETGQASLVYGQVLAGEHQRQALCGAHDQADIGSMSCAGRPPR